MSNITSFKFDGQSVRVLEINGNPWFVGKDVAEALGYANPNDIIRQHCNGVAKRYPIQTAGGRQEVRILSESDVLRLIVKSTLPSAEKFERWVFEDVLPTIRKTGGHTANNPVDTLKLTIEAALALPALIRAGRMLGLDKNAAAIAANQAIYEMTNVNLMQQLGHTHLEAKTQDSGW